MNSSSRESNSYQLACYFDQLLRRSRDYFALVSSEAIRTCVQQYESLAKDTLYKEIQAVRPDVEDTDDLMCQADEIALFNSLTSYALMCGNRKLIYELTDAILSELKEEHICELNDMIRQMRNKCETLLCPKR